RTPECRCRLGHTRPPKGPQRRLARALGSRLLESPFGSPRARAKSGAQRPAEPAVRRPKRPNGAAALALLRRRRATSQAAAGRRSLGGSRHAGPRGPPSHCGAGQRPPAFLLALAFLRCVARFLQPSSGFRWTPRGWRRASKKTAYDQRLVSATKAGDQTSPARRASLATGQLKWPRSAREIPPRAGRMAPPAWLSRNAPSGCRYRSPRSCDRACAESPPVAD